MRQKKHRFWGLALWALGCLAALVCYWRLWSVNQLDADMASEQVLANLLAGKAGFPLLATDWYYSTELRVFNTQLVMMPLFRLFSDWHTVRTAGSLILILLYLAAYFFFARKAQFKYGGLFGAALLLLPFGALYRQYVLQGLYYIPHIAINFFALGCVFWALKSRGVRRAAAVLLLCLFSFAAGLGGPRQIAILQIPLTLAVLVLAWVDDAPKAKGLRKISACLCGAYRPLLLLCAAADVCGVAGYALNAGVLSKRYHFMDQGYVAYADFSFARVQQLVSGIFASFGWQNGAVFSLATLFNFVAVVLIIFSFGFSVALVRGRARYPQAHRLLGAFFLAMAAAFFVLYAFTNSGHSERYMLPLAVLFIPLFEVYLADKKADATQKQTAGATAIALALALCLHGGAEYAAAAGQTNSNLPVAEFLAANGYTQGYASFWDANILTELSNGQIEVWTVAQNNDFEVRTWLQKTEHLTQDPASKVFFAVSLWEQDGERQPVAQGLADAMPQEALIYEDDAHLVYGFDSAAAMRSACGFGG